MSTRTAQTTTTTQLRPLALLALAAAGAAACGGPGPRFLLRDPVTREVDRPLARSPQRAPDWNAPYSIDGAIFRPMSRVFLLETPTDARNVNALDEVPDSSWFTNRDLSPDAAGLGACAGVEPPVAPFTITSSKQGGVTLGYFVRDARGRRFAFKFDQYPQGQPEINTAADAIVSRMYHFVGYNTPCNQVTFVRPTDFVLAPDAYYTSVLGNRHRLEQARVNEQLATRGVRLADGSVRMSASLFIEGEPLGPWSAEGTRPDDPNDLVPHEHRRELRAEHLLAAWVHHWDARAPNSYDSFVRAPDGRGGYVRHWQIDFADSLGARSTDRLRWPRQGHTHTFEPGMIAVDAVSLGLARRPWDDARIDPAFPTLGYFDVEHFDPGAWVPANPSPRFDAARPQDHAWMARRIARMSPEHLRAMITAGRLSNPAVAQRLDEVLLGRRARLLRWSFDRVSPLADLAMADERRLCAIDLAITTGLAPVARTGYAVEARVGEGQSPSAMAPTIERGARPGEVCFTLPPHFAPAGAPDGAPARYATLAVDRQENGARTRLRAHFYDLGPGRGYRLVGIER